jgi:hypothetical protein
MTDDQLEPLSQENNPTYPQEKKVYFAMKKRMKNYVLHVFHGIIYWVKTFQTKEFRCFGNYSDEANVEKERKRLSGLVVIRGQSSSYIIIYGFNSSGLVVIRGQKSSCIMIYGFDSMAKPLIIDAKFS